LRAETKIASLRADRRPDHTAFHFEEELPAYGAQPTQLMSEKITEFSSYGKDTPVGRPDIDGRAGVFVPNDGFDLANSTTIRKGAGIVGFGNPDGSLTIYFEANRFDDSSLHKWENKTRKAYDRMVMGAPTVSKAKIDARQLDQVGHIDGTGIHVKLPDSLHHWLEVSDALDTAPADAVITWRSNNK